ncbi:hypothetical protein NDU88_004771 [Pleurodeles waltl]|uniref:Uncharacterized protein n=1 Tax=Pleurodeles waltl TaxID=8319 RepID=A0AAV7WWE4_PLEWA|nr:hypothetical protein NDU88_004771 [Pleurodeles waltl]
MPPGGSAATARTSAEIEHWYGQRDHARSQTRWPLHPGLGWGRNEVGVCALGGGPGGRLRRQRGTGKTGESPRGRQEETSEASQSGRNGLG